MNIATYTRRYNNLIKEISIHPHKDEIMQIMYQQIQEDNHKTFKNNIINTY